MRQEEDAHAYDGGIRLILSPHLYIVTANDGKIIVVCQEMHAKWLILNRAYNFSLSLSTTEWYIN